jgi:hypothetical protein
MASTVVILVSSGVIWASWGVVRFPRSLYDFVDGYMIASVVVLAS